METISNICKNIAVFFYNYISAMRSLRKIQIQDFHLVPFDSSHSKVKDWAFSKFSPILVLLRWHGKYFTAFLTGSLTCFRYLVQHMQRISTILSKYFLNISGEQSLPEMYLGHSQTFKLKAKGYELFY